MIKLKKQPNKNFKILNISDPQLDDSEWNDGEKSKEIITNTFAQLIERVKPDLITVSGDLSWSGCHAAYGKLADMLDSYGIPWAPVWGNHDNQGGADNVKALVDIVCARKHCIYESGDEALGNGNYVILIEENEKPVEGVIMMDSHDRMPYTDENGNVHSAWAKLYPEQVEWYKAQVKALQEIGCEDTTLVMHIPIYAYREAVEAALPKNIDPRKVSIEDSYKADTWNEGYKNSFGVMWEGDRVCSYPADDGMMDAILELGSTKHVIAGHDHVNNFVIEYKGVKLIYSLKLGLGCYWNPKLNGGTVLTVTGDGVTDVKHEYVNDYI
ncbi:MAG: hypothetical protein E7312_03260 [Clostridiales bacterium]|nr:hypothetical protein [Clostridiales bacterium]